MGYDFFMVQRPAPQAGYAPLDPEQPEYFRFASHAMEAVLTAMRRAGVVDEDTPEPDLSEHWPPPTIAEDRFDELDAFFQDGEELDEPPTRAEEELYRAAEATVRRLAEVQSTDPHRVPAFKFCSNSDWWVSPAESRAIASGLREALASAPADLYPFGAGEGPPLESFVDLLAEWAAYNSVAAACGGYRVR